MESDGALFDDSRANRFRTNSELIESELKSLSKSCAASIDFHYAREKELLKELNETSTSDSEYGNENQ